jgi:hypothetical protein
MKTKLMFNVFQIVQPNQDHILSVSTAAATFATDAKE